MLRLAAGLMLGVVALDLIPEALSQQPGWVFGVPSPMLAFVLGFLVLHVIERALWASTAVTSPSTETIPTHLPSVSSRRQVWWGTA